MTTYLVCGCKPWNRRVFDEVISKLPGDWYYFGEGDGLDGDHDIEPLVAAIEPRYIFFLHWSWMVPPEVYENYECVNFHMTDLPYGRGGSPLQNLITSNHCRTVVTAHRMTGEVDAGPVYMRQPLTLDGTAESIYVRATEVSASIIEIMTRPDREITPVPQEGAAVHFTRRTPAQSVLPDGATLDQIHDHIRMLDAEGYPRAFLEYGNLRLEFHRAALYDGRVEASVTIREKK